MSSDRAPAAEPTRTLTIKPAGWQVAVPPGSTLLQAALQAGVRLPSTCRNGTCRACLCRLQQGAVRYTVAWPGLSVDEKAEGWVLPCVAQPLADVAIEAPGAQTLPGLSGLSGLA